MSEDLNDHDSHVIGALIEARDALRAKLDAATLESNRLRTKLDAAEKCVDVLDSKLDAAERAAAEMRQLLDRIACSTHPKLVNCEVAWQEVAGHCAELVNRSDAGREYVPKAEVDVAWHKGMQDAIHLIGNYRCDTDEQFAKDNCPQFGKEVEEFCKAYEAEIATWPEKAREQLDALNRMHKLLFGKNLRFQRERDALRAKLDESKIRENVWKAEREQLYGTLDAAGRACAESRNYIMLDSKSTAIYGSPTFMEQQERRNAVLSSDAWLGYAPQQSSPPETPNRRAKRKENDER